MDDASLPGHKVSGTARDRHETFERLIQPLIDTAFALAIAMLHDREAAEDAIQEACLKAWRHLPNLHELEGPPRAWFLTIVANQCRDARRARWRRVLRFATPPDTIHVDHAERVAGDVDLSRSIARLSPEARALLYLRYAQDMTSSEIARVLRLRPGTVKSRLHRAVLRGASPPPAVGRSPPPQPPLRRLETQLEEAP